ncbi:MAG: hypothetical protein COU66_04220 [Candidatus Pacebacteria bacterium CG10_big_fil_rev_8_21_14_0_10_44_11]|nr:MAG: hypothetical protein COU66_04220 [Candidatus Pacebacteria bacterium CG10_big_fil_rev_8_21_14_0_10_44_11]
MPELPEVETIARRLREVVKDKRLKTIQVLREKSFQGNPDLLVGSTIIDISRRAKILNFTFSNDLHLLVHLKMTGQLIFVDAGTRVGGGHPTDDWVNSLPSKHTRVVIDFEEPGTLFFNDLRVFGWMKVVDQAGVEKEYGRYAPDVNTPGFTLKTFQQKLANKSQPIKVALMDTSIVSGIGNIYANDALHLAKISPLRPAKSLSSKQVKAVYLAARAVIEKGIELGGATIKTYRTVDGLSGDYQSVVRVYQKESQPCLVCSTPIIRIKQAGRSTFYCPHCQK